MAIYESGEDYLEAVLMVEKEKGMVRSIDVANRLGYSKPSVSVAVKNLVAGEYLTMEKSKHLKLTEKGRAIAERIYDRHRTLGAVLMSLGVDKAQAERDACKVEHDLSDESYRAIKATWMRMLGAGGAALPE